MPDTTAPSLIRAVCFDWAGTTVDFGCHGPVQVFAAAFRGEGVVVSEAEVRAPMGMGKRDHIRTMLEQPALAERWMKEHGREADDSDIDRLYERFLPLQVEMIEDRAEPIAGVPELVRELAARGILVGSTTGYARVVMEVLEPLAADRGYAPQVCVTVDEAKRGRPAPDQNLAALRALGDIRPEQAVAVDDTTTGIEAGRNAGMWTVGVAGSGNLLGLDVEAYASLNPDDREGRLARARQILLDAGAHAVIDVVTDLLPLIDQFNRHLAEGRLPDEVLP